MSQSPRLIALWILTLFLGGCSGAETIVKKDFRNNDNTLAIVDSTSSRGGLLDAGSRLLGSLEDALLNTLFILSDDDPKYKLKFKITKFKEGSRISRLATLGMSNSAKGQLRVKAALFRGRVMVGAWEVETWVKGGMTGGSDEDLFDQAAKEIVSHMKGTE